MFVVKRTKLSYSRTGEPCYLTSYWNSKLQRYAAKPWGSALSAQEAESTKKNLERFINRNIYDPNKAVINIEPLDSETTLLPSPIDAPQFERYE